MNLPGVWRTQNTEWYRPADEAVFKTNVWFLGEVVVSDLAIRSMGRDELLDGIRDGHRKALVSLLSLLFEEVERDEDAFLDLVAEATKPEEKP